MVRGMVVVKRQAHLLEIIAALHPPGSLPRRLDRRQQKGNQDADDRDYDQELDQGKSGFENGALGL